MERFSNLYTALDETTKTNAKVAALVEYFAQADPRDAAWAVYFLSGQRPKRLLKSADLREWARELAGIPDWLLGECYDAVGDSAETITLLLPEPVTASDEPLSAWVEERLLPMQSMSVEEQRENLIRAWMELDDRQCFVWNKLITGSFRVGVSQRLLTRALAAHSGVDAAVIAHRLMGRWQPTPEFYHSLLAEETSDADRSRPYPFFLAYPLEEDPQILGSVEEWQAEWKWDGIRSQLIRREGEIFLWSRGEELITERFPELAEMAESLPDGVAIDGEILPWLDGNVMPFARLQRRIGRKTVSKRMLREVPVILLAYDLLELEGEDIRTLPLAKRREHLGRLTNSVDHSNLLLSKTVELDDWDGYAQAREGSRELGVEGLMLKRLDSPYRVGRKRGDWWKWKVDPYTVDAVLIYAQRGSGRRASLYSDYTFAVWDEDQLVPIAKAYSGLTDAEMRKVDAFVRRNTQDRFGPVRSVTPELVFELAFEDIRLSSRHKSGIAVRFPRILRWRHDKRPQDADSLETVKALLPPDPSL